MQFLARTYNYYTQELPEYQRLIEREMNLIDPHAILAVDEFMDLVAAPTAQGEKLSCKII